MILVTHDRDFLDDRKVPDHQNPGVVVLDVHSGSDTAAYRAAYFMACIVEPFGANCSRTNMLINANGDITFWNRNPDTGAMERRRYRRLPNRDVEEWIQ